MSELETNADYYGEKLPRSLTTEQREVISSIENLQLKEDVYLAVTGRNSSIVPSYRKPIPRYL